LQPAERARLDSILANFIADDKSNESVAFSFAGDAERRVFSFSQPTTHNGLVEENFRIPAALVERLLATGRAEERWCRIEAVTTDGNGRGPGCVRFLEPSGVSVISDIDDTIKETHVPAGKRAILRNTFLNPFRAAPGMLERYRAIAAESGPEADVCFHYVSGSPWQMYAPLHQFLFGEIGFPPGSFHMKNLRKNLLEAGALDSVRAFVLGGDLATLDQKVRQITRLLVQYPGRKFVLIGDSGERDPEVYRAIQRLFPEQIRRILIRDVLSERLAGMERIADEGISVSLDTSELEKEMMQLVVAARQVPADLPKL
jgi:phosphatidate phosphatase APP1